MTTACANVSIKYKGNGTQQVYSFPFTYLSWSDVTAFLYDETNKIWVNQQNKFIRDTATTLEFLTPPPASSIDNILITRNTDLQSMIATYYPGSSIRAQDLNDDFDQLRFAIQESKCDLELFKDELSTEFVEKSQVFNREDQESGKWDSNGDQDYLATSGAIAAREDTVVSSSPPPTVAYQQPGKAWENTDDCWSSYWNPTANAWVAYVNTGPRGVPGQDGTNGTDGATGPQGPQGAKGDPGTGINVNGYIDVPGPPATDGTTEGDYVIDSNGVGWYWETDTDPASWVDTGTIRGPQGEPGIPGTAGAAGNAATIVIDNTITGPAGTDASVINSGDANAAVLTFTIPQGAQGPPGTDGTGAGTVTDVAVSSPLTVTDAQGPVVILGFNMSLLATLP